VSVQRNKHAYTPWHFVLTEDVKAHENYRLMRGSRLLVKVVYKTLSSTASSSNANEHIYVTMDLKCNVVTCKLSD
jgi:hypothetical protein